MKILHIVNNKARFKHVLWARGYSYRGRVRLYDHTYKVLDTGRRGPFSIIDRHGRGLVRGPVMIIYKNKYDIMRLYHSIVYTDQGAAALEVDRLDQRSGD